MELVFVSHDERSARDAQRQVRSRATQHSHLSGTRKPKESKSGRKSKAAKRRGSSMSTVASSSSTISTRETSPVEEDDDRTITLSSLPSGIMAPLERLTTTVGDPFESYPVPAQPWFAEVLDYMWHFMLRGWQALGFPRSQQTATLIWVQRLTMSSAPYFLMNMLSTTGDLVSRGQQPAKYTVWLTGQVVATINQALNSPQTALAPGTVLAVGRIALREIVIGDMDAGVTFHRPAFARMILMAGGLGAFDLPPLVLAHIAWAERLMTRKTGVRMVQIEPALANEDVFGSKEVDPRHDTKVLDEYLPLRDR